jgi:Flp pilus assembly protein TadD
VERLLDRCCAAIPRTGRATPKRWCARSTSATSRATGDRASAARSPLAALLLGAVGWFGWQRGDLPAAAEAAPPERVVVLPIENATGDRRSRRAGALAEHCAQSLAARGGCRSSTASAPSRRWRRSACRHARRRIRNAACCARCRHAGAAATLARRRRFACTPRCHGAATREPPTAVAGLLLLATTRGARGRDCRRAGAIARDCRRRCRAAAYGAGWRRARGRLQDGDRAFEERRAPTRYCAAWLAQAQALLQAGMAERADAAAREGRAAARAQRCAAFAQVHALAGGDPAAAIAALQAHVKARPDDLDARLRLAQLQGQANALPSAIANLRELLRRDEADPRAWFLLGKFSIMHGEISNAVDESLVRALVLYKRGRNLYGQAETVNALGVAYSRLGQSEDAREQYGKAVELRRQLGDRRGVASSLRNLAQLSMVQGRFEEAQSQLDEARALFEAIGDADGLAAVDNELGLLAEERGDFAAAEPPSAACCARARAPATTTASPRA